MYYYNKRMLFLNILGFIITLTSILGIIFFFINPVITIVCAVLSILNSVIQIFAGQQNNFTTELITGIIAVIIAFIAKISYINTICIALCIGDVLMNIMGLIFIAFQKHR